MKITFDIPLSVAAKLSSFKEDIERKDPKAIALVQRVERELGIKLTDIKIAESKTLR